MKPMPSVLNARLNVFEDELTEQGMQKWLSFLGELIHFGVLWSRAQCQLPKPDPPVAILVCVGPSNAVQQCGRTVWHRSAAIDQHLWVETPWSLIPVKQFVPIKCQFEFDPGYIKDGETRGVWLQRKFCRWKRIKTPQQRVRAQRYGRRGHPWSHLKGEVSESSTIDGTYYFFGVLSLCIFLIKLPLISSHLVGITCPYRPRCCSLKFWKFFPGSLLAKNFWISCFGGMASHWSSLRVIPPHTPVTTPFQNQSGICSAAWCDKHYSWRRSTCWDASDSWCALLSLFVSVLRIHSFEFMNEAWIDVVISKICCYRNSVVNHLFEISI